MKKLFTALLCAALTFSLLASCGSGNSGTNANNNGNSTSANQSSGSASDAELPELTGGFEAPILLTSAGQSADSDIIKTLCTKANITVELENQATAENLDGVKTLLISVGGSSKGLGAAGISQEDELARAEAIVKTAKDNGITVIAAHLGGAARRGALSDQFNDMALSCASYVLVVEEGNDDGKFTDAATDAGIPITLLYTIADALTPLQEIFA